MCSVYSYSGWAVEKGQLEGPSKCLHHRPSAPEAEAPCQEAAQPDPDTQWCLQAEPRQGPQLLRPRLLLYCSGLRIQFVLSSFNGEGSSPGFKRRAEGKERKTRHTQQDNNNLFLITILPPDQAILNTS